MGGLTDARTRVGTGSRYNMQDTQGDSQITNRTGVTSREGGHGREESGEEEDIATLEELEELDTMLTAPWQGPGWYSFSSNGGSSPLRAIFWMDTFRDIQEIEEYSTTVGNGIWVPVDRLPWREGVSRETWIKKDRDFADGWYKKSGHPHPVYWPLSNIRPTIVWDAHDAPMLSS